VPFGQCSDVESAKALFELSVDISREDTAFDPNDAFG